MVIERIQKNIANFMQILKPTRTQSLRNLRLCPNVSNCIEVWVHILSKFLLFACGLCGLVVSVLNYKVGGLWFDLLRG